MNWYNNAIFYHIYPLGMLGCEKQNTDNQVKHRLLNLKPWIDYLHKNGFNALYIGPLFKSEGHGYETTDYRTLDNRLGDNDDLKEFVKYCHTKKIKVIFDAVLNHTGRSFFAFEDILQNRENSRYKDWYNVNFYGNNSYNDHLSYENWGGFDLLVKLNNKNPEVRKYLSETVKYWADEFDIDGIRIDAADVLDFALMEDLRNNLPKPDFFLLGEVIHGEYSNWVNPQRLDSLTNYHLYKALYSGLNEHNFFEIAHTINRQTNISKLYNFIDNHDVERITTRLNNKQDYKLVSTLLFTLPGIPSIYYGSELGIEGHKHKNGSDDEIRPAIDIKETIKASKNSPYLEIIKTLTKLRLNNTVLNMGDYRQSELTTSFYSYIRNYDGIEIFICLNNDDYGSHNFHFDSENYIDIFTGKAYSYEINVEPHDCAVLIPADTKMDIKPLKKEIEKPVIKKEEEAKPDSSFIEVNKPYEQMDIKELQDAILAKMAKNGPVTDQMLKSVRENIYHDSLINWVKSFR